MDSYEAEHFAYDEGGRRVADSTLALMVGFQPRVARPVMGMFSRAADGPAAAPRRSGTTTRRPPWSRSPGARSRRAACCCGRSRPAQGPEADRGPAADPQLPRRLRRRAARHLPGARRRGLPGPPRRTAEVHAQLRDAGSLPAGLGPARPVWRSPDQTRPPARPSAPRPAVGRTWRSGQALSEQRQPGVAEEAVEGDLVRRSAPRPSAAPYAGASATARQPRRGRGLPRERGGACRRSPGERRPRPGRRCRPRPSRSSRTRGRRRARPSASLARSPLA